MWAHWEEGERDPVNTQNYLWGAEDKSKLKGPRNAHLSRPCQGVVCPTIITVALQYNLLSDIMILPALLFLLNITLTILDLLCFLISFGIIFF